jgi:Tetracyclin repressor-like, C-terminal domain
VQAWLASIVESFATHRPVWAASFDLFVQSEHSPELREALASGYEHARPRMPSEILARTDLDAATARKVGSLMLALQAGLAAQWLLDPENAPSASDVADALRAICAAP